MPITSEEALDANEVLAQWHREGRKMPGYELESGSAFILKLLGLRVHPDWHQRLADYNQAGSTLYENLAGPHGWTLLKTAIIRMQEREAKMLKLRQAQRARLREMKENADANLNE